MTGQSSASESAQAYAFERYQAQSGGPIMDLMTLGVSSMMAAVKAVAAATEAGDLQHDPEAVDSAIKKFGDMQAVLDDIQRRSKDLAMKTPLGGGYAEKVSNMNQQMGELADGQVIPDLIKVIDQLKVELDRNRKAYRAVEESTSDTMNKL